MTKSEIIQRLTIQSGMKRKEVVYIVDNFIEKIKDSVQNGEKVEIRGFGTFCLVEKKARKIFSPFAGKKIDVPAKAILSFRASKSNENDV